MPESTFFVSLVRAGFKVVALLPVDPTRWAHGAAVQRNGKEADVLLAAGPSSLWRADGEDFELENADLNALADAMECAR